MPLLKGKANIGTNIKDMMHKYTSSGKIGNISPKTRAKARRIALAAALSTAMGPKK